MPTKTFLLVCHFWNYLGGALLRYEANLKVYLFLGLLSGALVNVNVRYCLGLPIRSHKVIHSWYVPLLGLSVHESGPMSNATNIGPGAGQQKVQGTLRPVIV